MWQTNTRGQQALGWARTLNPATTGGAYQQFEHGTMVWRADTSQIYVFFSDGTWRSFADTFEEGDRESDPAFSPPAGKLQPIRGFGKVWRDNADVREKLGWAQAKEMAQPAEVHNFERGAILRFGPLLFFVAGIDTDRGTWF
jgi:serine/threonine-protein kinase